MVASALTQASDGSHWTGFVAESGTADIVAEDTAVEGTAVGTDTATLGIAAEPAIGCTAVVPLSKAPCRKEDTG